MKRDRSSTNWNGERKKSEALDRVISHIIEHKEFNPGSVYLVKIINQKYIEYLSELEQPITTTFTEKLLLALPNLCSKIINKKLVVLFSDAVSTLVKDYIESSDDFFVALRKILLPVRREIFDWENNFSDELNLKCQKESIPKKASLVNQSAYRRLQS